VKSLKVAQRNNERKVYGIIHQPTKQLDRTKKLLERACVPEIVVNGDVAQLSQNSKFFYTASYYRRFQNHLMITPI